MDQQPPPFWSLPVAEVLGHSQTVPQGLSSDEATSRLKRYADCRLAPKKRTETVTLLVKQFSSPIVLLLLSTTVISIFLHDTTDAAIILVIVLLEKDLDVLVKGVQEGRTTFANTLKYVLMATSANFGNMFSMAGASLLLPFLPFAHIPGLTPLRPSSFAPIEVIVAMYIISGEFAKRVFYRHLEPARAGRP